MLQFIREFLLELFHTMNFPDPAGKFFTSIIILAGLIALLILMYHFFRFCFVGIAKWRCKKHEMRWLQAMLNHGFFVQVAKLLPAFFIGRIVPMMYPAESVALQFYKTLIGVYIIFMLVKVICAFLDVLNAVNTAKKGADNKPLKSYMQIIKVILWTMGTILIGCILANKTPSGLIAGIGAFSAVLLLVFQDTITGFVNSIQLSSNDMVRVGDWITDPHGEANGIVEEVNLIAVKVRNFDNSIVTVPIKSMVNNSFQNWRGMSERKVRRITRSIHIDVNSIRPCTPEMLEEFKKIDCIRDYITDTQDKIERLNEQRHLSSTNLPNGDFQTNLGILRAYMVAYLEQHPMVDETSLLMVRHGNPEENGLPMELYCFVRTTEWREYEALQSDLFDHFYAVLPFFDLRAFQRSSDYDVVK